MKKKHKKVCKKLNLKPTLAEFDAKLNIHTSFEIYIPKKFLNDWHIIGLCKSVTYPVTALLASH